MIYRLSHRRVHKFLWIIFLLSRNFSLSLKLFSYEKKNHLISIFFLLLYKEISHSILQSWLSFHYMMLISESNKLHIFWMSITLKKINHAWVTSMLKILFCNAVLHMLTQPPPFEESGRIACFWLVYFYLHIRILLAFNIWVLGIKNATRVTKCPALESDHLINSIIEFYSSRYF